jgi:translation initiation factor IF-3
VIDASGNMVGVMTVGEALSQALRSGLDLVEVSPNADPPVCRIMDFGKFKYEQARKDREARKHQHATEMKEIKFHANVGDHDFQTKVNHIRGFLAKGMKVKCSLYFRGRENAHRELGFEVMQRVLKHCEDVAQPDMDPKLIGNSIVMILGARAGVKAARPDRDAAPAKPSPQVGASGQPAGIQNGLTIPPIRAVAPPQG